MISAVSEKTSNGGGAPHGGVGAVCKYVERRWGRREAHQDKLHVLYMATAAPMEADMHGYE